MGRGKSAKNREFRKLKKKVFFKKKKITKKHPSDMMAETHRLSPNPTCHLES